MIEDEVYDYNLQRKFRSVGEALDSQHLSTKFAHITEAAEGNVSEARVGR